MMLAVPHHGTSPSAILTKPRAGCYIMLSTLSVMFLQGNTLTFFFFLIGASFFPQELKLIAVWHESEATRMPSWCPKEDGRCPTTPAQQPSVQTSHLARANPAENSSLLFWRRVRFLLVVTPWASSLRGPMRTHRSGAARSGGAVVAQGWREDTGEVVVAATC